MSFSFAIFRIRHDLEASINVRKNLAIGRTTVVEHATSGRKGTKPEQIDPMAHGFLRGGLMAI